MRKLSEQHKKKISKTLSGRKKSATTKKKMSQAHTGKKQSKETKQLISDKLKTYWDNIILIKK